VQTQRVSKFGAVAVDPGERAEAVVLDFEDPVGMGERFAAHGQPHRFMGQIHSFPA
jgi:hypothetical protein